MSRPTAETTVRSLVVDPIACEGVGLCAHLAGDVVDLDRWGYPVLPVGDLTRSQERQAVRAVRGCPRRALAIVDRERQRG